MERAATAGSVALGLQPMDPRAFTSWADPLSAGTSTSQLHQHHHDRPAGLQRTLSAETFHKPVQTAKPRSYIKWSPEEEDELRRAVDKFGRRDWDLMRQSPEFSLLSGRSATMLKNKWYKLQRSDRQENEALVENGNLPPVDSHSSARKPRVPNREGAPDAVLASKLHPSAQASAVPQKRGSVHLSDTLSSDETSFPNLIPVDTGDSTQTQPPHLAAATKKLNDSLEMLREALAIQVDANKAVAASVAARDSGTGDDEIVRTAVYVADLANAKAKKAREYVAAARKEHAAAVVAPAPVKENGELVSLMDGMEEDATDRTTTSTTQDADMEVDTPRHPARDSRIHDANMAEASSAQGLLHQEVDSSAHLFGTGAVMVSHSSCPDFVGMELSQQDSPFTEQLKQQHGVQTHPGAPVAETSQHGSVTYTKPSEPPRADVPAQPNAPTDTAPPVPPNIHVLIPEHEPNMCDDFFGLGFLDPNMLPSPPGFLKFCHDAIMGLGEHRD